jgi:hypothetical protein
MSQGRLGNLWKGPYVTEQTCQQPRVTVKVDPTPPVQMNITPAITFMRGLSQNHSTKPLQIPA